MSANVAVAAAVAAAAAAATVVAAFVFVFSVSQDSIGFFLLFLTFCLHTEQASENDLFCLAADVATVAALSLRCHCAVAALDMRQLWLCCCCCYCVTANIVLNYNLRLFVVLKVRRRTSQKGQCNMQKKTKRN